MTRPIPLRSPAHLLTHLSGANPRYLLADGTHVQTGERLSYGDAWRELCVLVQGMAVLASLIACGVMLRLVVRS